MTTPDQGQSYDIPVSLDTEGVVSGAQQGEQAVTSLQAALAGLTIGAVAAGRGLDSFSSRTGRNIFGSASVTAAANFQQAMSGLAATAAVTGQRLSGFRSTVEQLARSMPGGTSQAIATVSAVQQLGLAAKNQQPQIRALSQEFTRLGAAVGESAPQMATDFGQLNRELASLDPTRLSRFADVLTQLHATSGSSAASIIGFSQAIAPVAQAAGIGEAAILGISTAFTKLGDDGGAAATAVNKILTDLNTSVNTGANSMIAYANATGMTVKQFRQLYETNPAAALTKTVGAIGTAGPQSQFLLQTLGLDPARTQRALLELSQSGGLGSTINTALGAYGNGSTNRAAASAFNTVNDKMQMLTSTSQQLGVALGTPILRPFGAFLDLLNKMVTPLAAIANSGVGQAALGVAGLGLVGLKAGGLGLRGVRGLSDIALGYGGLTSGPVGSLLGGFRSARYGEAGAQFGGSGWLANTYNPIIGAGVAGEQMGASGFMSGINRRIYTGAQGLTSRFGTADEALLANAAMAREGGGGFRNFMRTAAGGAGVGFGGYMRLASAPFRLASQNAMDRNFTMLQPGGPTDTLIQGIKAAGGNPADSAQALRAFTKELRDGTPVLHRVMQDMLSYAGAVGGFGLQSGVGLAKAGTGLVGSLLGGISPLMLAAGAGVGAYALISHKGEFGQNINNAYQNNDIYGVINQFKDSLGIAGTASLTMAQQIAQASQTLAAATTTMSAATHLSTADIQAFGTASASKVTHPYTGTPTQIAAQISAESTTGYSPQVLQGIKQSLYEQGYNPSTIDQVLGLVGNQANGQVAPSTIGSLVSHIAANSGPGAGQGFWTRNFSANAIKRSISTFGGLTSGWDTLGSIGSPTLTKAGMSTLSDLQNSIGQGYQANVLAGRGPRYAAQSALQQAQAALQDALSTHNADTVVAVEQALTKQLTGKSVTGLTASDIQSLGLTGVLATQTLSQGYQSKIMGTTPLSQLLGSTVNPQHMTPLNVTALRGQARALFGGFYGGGTTGVEGMVTNAANQPANAGLVNQTAIAVVSAMAANGTTMNAIATAATNSLNTTSTGQQVIQQAILAQAQYVQSSNMIGMTQGQQFAASTAQAQGLMSANGPNSQAQFQQGQQIAQTTLQNLTSYYQQRIMAQFNYQIQSTRSQEDYNLQMSRNDQDFQIQSLRNLQDYQLQVKRNIQDMESSEYNPYQRINAQPVLSGEELAANLAQQNGQLALQQRNLNAVRAAGLSAAAVNVLGLAQASNAQQLQAIATNIASDPNLVNSINKEISKRGGLTKGLYTDKGDVAYQRMKQDYDIQTSRLQADFQLQQSRAAQDFTIASERMAQDLHDSDLQITGNMTTLQKDMIRIMHGQSVDWSKSLVNMLDNTIAEMKPRLGALEKMTHGAFASVRNGGGGVGSAGSSSVGTVSMPGGFKGGGGAYGAEAINGPSRTITDAGGNRHVIHTSGYVDPGSGKVYGGATQDAHDEEPIWDFRRKHPPNVAFNRGIARAMLPSFGFKSKKDIDRQMEALDWVWGQHESGWSQYATNPKGAYGIPQSNPGWKMKKYGNDWQTNPATQIKWGLDYITTKYGTPVHLLPVSMGGQGDYKLGHGYAAGGIALGPTFGEIAEAGSPEMMLPLNSVGMTFLINTIKQYVGTSEAASITSGGQATAVTINAQSYHYDSRTQYNGPMRFELTDPEKLGKQLDRRQRQQNLTASKGGPKR